MHSPVFIDQDPDALRLTVVEGELSREDFSLYKQRFWYANSVAVDAAVIGASHTVRFTTTDELEFHEVFACVDVPAYPSLTLDKLVQTPIEYTLDGWQYVFTAKRFDWPDPASEPPELTALVDRASGHRPDSFGVVQPFPRGRLLVDPKTIIVGCAREDGDGISVTTGHSYPGQGYVVTETTLTRT